MKVDIFDDFYAALQRIFVSKNILTPPNEEDAMDRFIQGQSAEAAAEDMLEEQL